MDVSETADRLPGQDFAGWRVEDRVVGMQARRGLLGRARTVIVSSGREVTVFGRAARRIGRLLPGGGLGGCGSGRAAGRVWVVMAALVLAFVATPSAALAVQPPAAPGDPWVGSWGAAPAGAQPDTPNGYPNVTLRFVVRMSVGGSLVRVRLTNAYGSRPLVIRHATVALADGGGPAAVAGTMRDVTFGGSGQVTIPVGAEAVSDAVDLQVADAAKLLVSTYTDVPSGPITWHPFGFQRSFGAVGDRAAQERPGNDFFYSSDYARRYVSGVDVSGDVARASVVTLGDSITDGAFSTPEADKRWPDLLANRLMAEPAYRGVGVINSGIAANRLVSGPIWNSAGDSGLSRLDRDVFTRSGVRTLIVLEGINDIQLSDAPALQVPLIIDGYRQIIKRARERGICVLGGTLLPFGGYGTYTPQREAARQAVNTFIRTGNEFDGVIDFDAVMRDPSDHRFIEFGYTSDRLHPNDAGFQRMADAVPLNQLCLGQPQADLAVVKQGPGRVDPGGAITYNITVTNNGPGASTGWTLTDPLPAGLQNPTTTTPGCTITGTTLTCTGGPLAAGASYVVTVHGTAPNNSPVTLNNTVTVKGNDPDPDQGNNTATAMTDVNPIGTAAATGFQVPSPSSSTP